MPDTEVAVIGAGVVGAAAAWALARRGVRVTLVEQFEPANPWGASHGRARIFRLAYPDAFHVRLAAAALPLWQDLERVTGTEVLTLTGGVDHGEAPALAILAGALTEAGVPHRLLPASAARERWPGLAFEGDVLHHAQAGRLDAEAAVHALVRAAGGAGAELLTGTPVECIEVHGPDDVRLPMTHGTLRARQVVVAAGGWTAALLAGVPGPVLPRLTVTQEQPALFVPVEAAWPSFIHHTALPADGVYGLGGPEGVKAGRHGIGRVVRPQDRQADAVRIDEAELARLVEYARRWLPGVDGDRATPQPCTYTSTADGAFVIGRTGPVTVAAGFSGHGFKFGPALGELVAGHVLGPQRVAAPDGTPDPAATGLPGHLHATAARRFDPTRPRTAPPRPGGR